MGVPPVTRMDRWEDFSWEFGDGTSGTGVTVQHSYGAPGEYLVRLTVRDDQNASDTTSKLVEISAPQGPALDLATADVATPGGNLSGDFTATHTQDDQNQTLSETHSGGKPSNRYDTAEHIWRFDLDAGNHVLNVDAHVVSPAGDGDSGFDLQWATSSEGPWATLLTVSATSDQDSYLSASIGSQTVTTVYLRAIDNDSTTGNLTYSSLLVDHLFFDGGTPPDAPPGPATDPAPAHGFSERPPEQCPKLAGRSRDKFARSLLRRGEPASLCRQPEY